MSVLEVRLESHLDAIHGRVVRLEIEREADGRWLAEALDFPGVVAYGPTPLDAKRNALALVLQVMANEPDPS